MLMRVHVTSRFEITTDGVTVWVNGEAGLVGRFGRNGIDIHRTPEEQGSMGQCLFCTHEVTTEEDWTTFQVKMKEIFGVSVPDTYKPIRFKPS